MQITDNYNKGTKYLEKNNYSKALQFLKRETGDFKEKWLNIGNSYRGLGNDVEAGKAYLKAADESRRTFLGQAGKYPLALNNLGLLCYRNGDDAAAIEFYKKALEVNPNHVDTLWNYSISMLRSGISGMEINWYNAWALYEYRFQKGTKLDRSVGRWFGGPADVVTVLAEQGFGDKFMFWRYLWKVREECGGEVLVQCVEELHDFVRSIGFEPCTVARGRGIPVCSLAWKYGNHETSNYAGTWTSGSGIGVVWSGSKTHANNTLRSCVPGYFKRFLDFDQVIGLNPGLDFGPIKCGVNGEWMDTARVLMGLKCVVTVDTAIVHLAGALGVPCVMIQPLKETDYRWGVDMDRSIWYPNLDIVVNSGWDAAFDKAVSLVAEKYQ